MAYLIFLLGKLSFVCQDSILWFNISWNLTKFQLIQTTYRKNGNKSDIKFCGRSRNLKSTVQTKVLFQKKYEVNYKARIVIFSTNRWRLHGGIFVLRFWIWHQPKYFLFGNSRKATYFSFYCSAKSNVRFREKESWRLRYIQYFK